MSGKPTATSRRSVAASARGRGTHDRDASQQDAVDAETGGEQEHPDDRADQTLGGELQGCGPEAQT